MDITSLFDPYSRKARLAPALFALLSPILSVAIWVPSIYELIAGLLSLLIVSGVLIVLANMARYKGHKTQERLVEAWGGLPSSTLLRHRDNFLDSLTKQRYHRYFNEHIDGMKLPSENEEANDPKDADDKYASACKWLLEQTRDKSRFGLLFKENIEYGFRRNMRGLKPIGLTLSFLSAAVGAYILYLGLNAGILFSGAVAVLLSTIAFTIWAFLVTDDWVHYAAKSYAVRLLSSCDATT